MLPSGGGRAEAGCFTISVDTELAWGTNAYGEFQRFTRHLERSRPVIGRLLELFETYRVSATWAVVGHLFLSECKREGKYPHPDVLVPAVRGMEHWHMYDPASNLRAAPLWYGRDIVDAIRRCLQPQELGCHTFSHVRADLRGCTPEVFRSQIKKCLELAEAEGIRFKSFVYPENGIAHLEVLKEFGFACYRGRPPSWETRLPRPLRRLVRLAECALPTDPPTYAWPRGQGLLNIPGSMLLVSTDGTRRLIPTWCRLAKAKRGLDRAVERGEIFHLWFHPWNLAVDPGLLECLEDILRYADELRERHALEVLTMGEIADRAGQAAGRELQSAA